MLTERLQDVFAWPSKNRRSGASDHQKKNEKRPRGIGPRRFSPPPREQNILRSLKIRAQVVYILKLMIYRIFDVLAVISPYASFPHPSPCDNTNP